MNQITISWAKECEVWRAASEEKVDSRCATVRVEPAGFLLATDGHIAAVVPCEIEGAPEGWEGCLMPASFVKAAMASARTTEVRVTLTDGVLTAPAKKGYDHQCLVASGIFPALWRIVKGAAAAKGSPCGTAVALDPWLMARVAQAIGCPKNTPVCHEWSGEQRAILVYSDTREALGLLMPGCKSLALERSKRGTAVLSQVAEALAPVGQRQAA